MLPKVAIVGRPNVGKSSLFNWLANVRISIVEPTPYSSKPIESSLAQTLSNSLVR